MMGGFPDNSTEALAFLWVQNQDLSGKTPTEINAMYYDAEKEMRKDYQAKKDSGYLR